MMEQSATESRYTMTMSKFAPLLFCVCLASTAIADPTPEIKGTYGFNVIKPKTKCQSVTGSLLKTLRKYSCTAGEAGSSASGKAIVAECSAKRGSTKYLLLASKADCEEERQTQLANGD